MKNITNHTRLILISIVIFLTGERLQATIYEAENATLYHAVTETKNSGFIGDSYVNFDNEIGSYIEFTVNMGEEGVQTLLFRYANAGTMARPMQISLNGLLTDSIVKFNLTNGWTDWVTEPLQLPLVQGINTIRLTSMISEGGPNLDNLTVSGTQGKFYQVSLSTEGPGSVSVTPEIDSFYTGQMISITANSQLGGEFLGWTGDTSGTVNPLEIIVDKNKSIGAYFRQKAVEMVDPDFSMSGYAAVAGEGLSTTTGGNGGIVTVVSTLDELLAYAKSRENNTNPEILIIKGYIESPTSTVVTIKHGANITILGASPFGEMNNVGLNIWDYNNVIIRNMKIHEVIYPNDAITINACNHVWVDHNELFSKIGSGITVDTYDGLLDIKEGSNFVTVSWNYLHHHMKCSLIGHSDSNGDVDTAIRVTIHHNYYSHTDGRNPSLRFGAIHFYNNFEEDISDYGLAIRQGAHAKIENNHFESVVIPVTTNKFSGPEGFVCMSGNVYTGTCSENSNSITQTDCGFWKNLSYSYSPDPAETVAPLVQNYSGVGIINTETSVYLDTLTASAGKLIPSFNPDLLVYKLEVPPGTSTITIAANSENAAFSITGTGTFSSIPGTAEITVHSADLAKEVTYKIIVKVAGLSSNSLLKSLSTQYGSLNPVFDPLVYNYSLVIPAGTNTVNIEAEPADTTATVAGSGTISDFSKPASIIVTAQDGSERTYFITISVENEISTIDNVISKFYPHPATDYMIVETSQSGILSIYSISGEIMMEKNIFPGETGIPLKNLQSGVYILRMMMTSGCTNSRLIIRK